MFDLSSIRKSGTESHPPRIFLYGGPKIGKTTFGACAPNPIFIQTERGTDALSVDVFPFVENWQMLSNCFEVLATQDHDYKTVILDSADWTENILKSQVAKDHGVIDQKTGEGIYDTNAKALSFGRGSRAVEEYWHRIADSFDWLRNNKGMGCIVISHAAVKRYDDPTSEAYDRYQPDLLKDSAAVLQEWCDVLLFANKPPSVISEKVGIQGVKKRAVSSDQRLMYTSETPAFKAGSRWNIPTELPLGYDILMKEIEAARERARQPAQLGA